MKYFMFCMLCISALLFFPGCSGKKENAGEVLKKAVAAANEANWSRAQELADHALELDPKNPDILLFSALTLEQNGNRDGALNRLRTLSGMTDDFRVQYTLGRLLFQKKDIEKSLVPLRHALKARPGDLNTLILLAKAETKLGTKDALVYQKQLLLRPEFRNNKDVYNEIAVLLALSQNGKAALTVIKAKCSEEPVSVLNAAIICDCQLNDRVQAVEWYNRYLRLTANRAELHRDRLLVTQRLSEIR